jgi:DNA repair protein RadD
MSFTPRPYQTEAIEKGVTFFQESKKYNGLQILPTGSGKSVVIANMASQLQGKTVVFQPSKEILEQNFKKFISYGYRAGIYSASAGMKFMDDITFATIGSVAKKAHLFRGFRNIIIDECHLVSPTEGMYRNFINATQGAKVLGLTATPYRLETSYTGAQLTFLTRSQPSIFKKVLYYVQNKVLFDSGHLAPLVYKTVDVIDRTLLEMNSTGTDFTEASVRSYFRRANMPGKIIEFARSILKQRKNLMIFCATTEDARKVCNGIPGSVMVTADTDSNKRTSAVKGFKSGNYRCLVNVKCFDTGFDYPALEAVLIGKSTMSLAVYYQEIGRVMRPYTYSDGTSKEGWVIDLGGNTRLFGRIETMEIRESSKGFYSVWNDGKQLTNVPFSKN